MFNNQYQTDLLKCAALINKFTGVSQVKLIEFLKIHTVKNIPMHITELAVSEAQKQKLSKLLEFNNLFMQLKTVEKETYFLNGPGTVKDYVINSEYIANRRDREVLIAIFMNRRNEVIKTSQISSGSLSSAIVDPYIICKEAFLNHAARLILVHNHPSGDSSPSNEDKTATQKIFKALLLVKIDLLDHCIIGQTAAGDDSFLSLRAEFPWLFIEKQPLTQSSAAADINEDEQEYEL
jgi:DNA repair protein RadC